MSDVDLNNKTFTNLMWRFAERSGAQGVSFVVSIILARILAPEDYGTITLVSVFTNILQVFVDSGMGSALIQKKDADDVDFSSVFYFNFTICLILYALMFFVAPSIASYFELPELASIVRVISLTVVISGVRNVQQAYVSRNMLFKRFFFSTLGGTIFSAVIGIVMAYLGFGVWALIAQQLSNAVIDTLILWVTVKWRPKKQFSWNRIKLLLTFGWKLLFSSLLDTIYNNLRSLIIGKMYSSADLAYYNKGTQFPYMIVTNINTSIDSVLLPAMSNEQDDKLRLRSMTRRAIKISSYIMWPLMVGLAVCAKSIVVLLLTEKWLPCVPYMQLFCITYALWPIHTANLNAIKAMGRSDVFLRLEIIKKIIGIISIIVSIRLGVFAIAVAYTITSPISAIINAVPNKSLMGYSYKDQVMDLFPSIVLALIMGVIVHLISLFGFSTILTLFIQVMTGLTVYFFGSFITKNDSFKYLMQVGHGITQRSK